ncbi:hypothetical protein [Subtercola boreus]|uniref:4-hydroxybenzoate polyprenyltransferase n=1 Tax=Subtercola boreus TaxID=120213 RepID=A0A3E0WCQ4_9MICO|nr:hypothetical protein [Subtercola boreus]RFA22144.1 hypothetical protein B7R24_05575 [Subtercola boreus]RFA22324.1 hypothetical protein B7R23_05520 [Subtercola boreus]RFA28187.1 hypothetical protein B7R25_05645 [Subtercola boreus]
MSVVTSAIVLSEGAVNHLPFPGVFFGLIAFAIFLACGFVMWSYRDVANRHPRKSAEFAQSHDLHGHGDRTGADH